MAADLPRGALLLERLDASRSLASIPLAQAAATAGALIRTLAIQPPPSFPALQAAARQLAATFAARQRSLQDPIPHQQVTLAARLAAEEYRSELWELALVGDGRIRQLRYALRQLRRAPSMGFALRSRHRGSAMP